MNDLFQFDAFGFAERFHGRFARGSIKLLAGRKMIADFSQQIDRIGRFGDSLFERFFVERDVVNETVIEVNDVTSDF